MTTRGCSTQSGYPTPATSGTAQQAAGFAITKVHLVLEAKVPGLAATELHTLAEAAKVGCPVSKVLNAEILLSATLRYGVSVPIDGRRPASVCGRLTPIPP